MLSVCFILHIGRFVRDHSARCPEHTLAGLDPSWMRVARTAEDIPAKASRLSHDFPSSFPCHIMTTLIFFTDAFWWDQLHRSQPVYPSRALLAIVHTQLTAQRRDGAFLKGWRKRSVLFPAAFFLYPTSSRSHGLSHLLRCINLTSFPYTPF